MPEPPNAAERIASRFWEQRAASGRRISIDDVMAELSGVPDLPATRLSALRLIAERRPTAGGSSGRPPETDQTVELPQIDGYEVIDVIGRGGMGVVYEAYQHSTGRRVAIKFMLEHVAATESARRRFEREIELVARLQHPAVVAVMDSGVHAGRPYFTMEFIDGCPLDNAVTPGVSDVSETLRLIAQIADAADFAHQRGVLHRDLKPSNILIDSDGRPHILDFGLAKAFDTASGSGPRMTLSEPGQIIGTLAYMAPEQARGEYEQLSIRSDVYALGAIAYELITGRLPQEVEGALADVLGAIAQRDPPRPSSLRRGLSADVNAILLKCLEKSPQNRYATAGELAADIRRFLDHRSIVARRAGAAARTARWVRRNRAVSAVGAVSLAIIVSGTVYGFVRVLRERDRANEQRALAEKRASETLRQKSIADAINEFLNNDLLSAVAPAGERDTARGKDVKMRDVLDEAARRIDGADKSGGRFADRPEVEAAIRNTIGNTYFELGEWASAKRHLQRSLELRRRMLGDDHPDTLTSINDMGVLLQSQGKLAEAEPYFREAVERMRRVLGDENANTLSAIANMGFLLHAQGKLAEAEPYCREAMEKTRRVLGDEHPHTLNAINNMANLVYSQGKPAEAERYQREALEKMRRALGDEHPDTLNSISNLGYLLQTQGKLAEAEPYYREALEKRRRVLGQDHPSTLLSISNMGSLLRAQGKLAEAEPYYRETMEKMRRVLGDEHPNTLTSINNMSRLLCDQGKFAEAEKVLSPALDFAQRTTPPAQLCTMLFRAATELYMAWNRVEPGRGFDAKADEWRAKLRIATSQPAALLPTSASLSRPVGSG